jgi:hypothetical protein
MGEENNFIFEDNYQVALTVSIILVSILLPFYLYWVTTDIKKDN